jgi:tetratricopeptide (TPR) repeat protein
LFVVHLENIEFDMLKPSKSLIVISSFVLLASQVPGIALAAEEQGSQTELATTLIGPKPQVRSLLPDGSLAELCRDVRINAIVVPAFCTLLVNARDSFNRKDFRAAISTYNQALVVNPQYSAGYYNRAIARLAVGESQAAKADLIQAAHLWSEQGDHFNHRRALEVIRELGA